MFAWPSWESARVCVCHWRKRVSRNKTEKYSNNNVRIYVVTIEVERYGATTTATTKTSRKWREDDEREKERTQHTPTSISRYIDTTPKHVIILFKHFFMECISAINNQLSFFFTLLLYVSGKSTAIRKMSRFILLKKIILNFGIISISDYLYLSRK